MEKLLKKSNKIEKQIGERVDCETLDLIYEFVELQILLEQENDK